MKKPALLLVCALWLASLALAADPRAVKLDKFIASCNPSSPLIGKGAEIVRWADKYKIDYRLYVALAGVESGFGRHYPRRSHNLTGISNGGARFRSVDGNIEYTSRIIGSAKYYRKYRRTKRLEDLVYVYKAVPPYDRYIRNVKLAFDYIAAVPVVDTARVEKTLASGAGQQAKADKIYRQRLLALNTIRYDRYAIRQTTKIALRP
ncbi:MAG TPA: hypothetical protein VMT55_05285 [Candidatus Sulfotelmatobacter sp.]|nr:hypothetical protein [Candidatus Sulfotelmatobacter sp.]